MIAPQTNIRLLNTPLENDGSNTLTWDSVSQQTNYFLSRTVYSYPNCTYQRKTQAIRIDKNIDTLYNCNYVMYQNAGHSNKWFYAFIDELEYINDDVTLVYLVPDEFQTWYFNIEFKDSFVHREHTNNDTIGSNRTDEGLGIGGYTTVKKEKMYEDTTLIAMLTPYNSNSGSVITYNTPLPQGVTINPYEFGDATNHTNNSYVLAYDNAQHFTLNGADISGTYWNYGISVNWQLLSGAFTCSFNYSFREASNVTYWNGNYIGYGVQNTTLDIAGYANVQQWFNDLASQSLQDDIGAFYVTTSAGYNATTPGTFTGTETKTFVPVKNIDGYVPKNNKLFIFPYTTIKVHNGSDSSRVLQPELFNNYNSMTFKYWCDHLPSSPVTAIPRNYGGVADGYEYAINSAKYPISSASYDAFKNYLGIHAAEYNIRVASSLASGALSIASGVLGLGGTSSSSTKTYKGYTDKRTLKGGEVVPTKHGRQQITSERETSPSFAGRASSVISGATEIASTLAEANAKQREAYDTVGGVQANALQSVNAINIYIEQQTVTAEYAKRIDDYFSMYGYKTNLVKVPNLTGRRNWNYVETKHCNIIGEIPNESMDTIRAMFDTGVTLWHNPDTFLDYSQDNSIL